MTLAGLLFLTLHFGLIALSSLSVLPMKQPGRYVAKAYTASFFHQSWDLFVPPPDHNYRLFASFTANGTYTLDVFEDLVLKHQENRFKGYGPPVVAFSNCISYFEQNTTQQDPVNHVANDLHFRMIEQAAENYLQFRYHSGIDHLKLILVVEDISTKQQRIYFNR